MNTGNSTPVVLFSLKLAGIGFRDKRIEYTLATNRDVDAAAFLYQFSMDVITDAGDGAIYRLHISDDRPFVRMPVGRNVSAREFGVLLIGNLGARKSAIFVSKYVDDIQRDMTSADADVLSKWQMIDIPIVAAEPG